MNAVRLAFPNQLFKNNKLFEVDGDFYLIEEHLFFNQYNFHQQKIAFHRASMKFYENYLAENGFKVNYVAAQDAEADIKKLIATLGTKNVEQIYIIDPVDDWLLSRIKKACHQHHIKLQVFDSPKFLNTTDELVSFFNPDKQSYFQTAFYKQQRIAKKMLIQGLNEPVGGKWSFDEENRKKYPKGKAISKLNLPTQNTYVIEAKKYTNKYFGNNIGSLDGAINYPTNFKESEDWLTDFLKNRFKEFGDYEDAIVRNEILINHSLLTPMLNVGLLTPHEVLKTTIDFANKNNTPINSLEGFIRQIIGWREFIRGVYITKGSKQRTTNFWGFSRKIPQSFYNGTTGILPFDETIKKVLKTGYCHHWIRGFLFFLKT